MIQNLGLGIVFGGKTFESSPFNLSLKTFHGGGIPVHNILKPLEGVLISRSLVVLQAVDLLGHLQERRPWALHELRRGRLRRDISDFVVTSVLGSHLLSMSSLNL